MTFVADANERATGEVIILDANITACPLARVKIRQRAPTGFPETWVQGDQLRSRFQALAQGT